MAAQVLAVLCCGPAGPAGTALTTNRKGAGDQSVGLGSTDDLSGSGNSALIEHTIPI